ncbi:MAG: Transcriptional regulator/sugar kinase [Acidobacteria bacterium]|jgi:predicted NBD/HSP70 family sugar kinase|nr:Transcriptional regulator/sugar kinase [Acidobacteriota bacterium]
MNVIPNTLSNTTKSEINTPAKTAQMLLRLIRAAQTISRADLARRLKVDRSTVTAIVKPLIASELVCEKPFEQSGSGGKTQGRPPIGLSFNDRKNFFIGLSLGVRRTQIGMTTLNGESFEEDDFETPSDAETALRIAREKIEDLRRRHPDKNLKIIGVSVPGLTDINRQKLLFAPNLGWSNLEIAGALQVAPNVKVVVENDATAAAMYEARMKIRHSSSDGLMTNFILVRSGTGIGVGLVIGSEVYRGSGLGRGIAGEFGHMTVVAGGKSCVCGNRGCWEKYASAASAASLYLGDRPARHGESTPRFIEIVTRAAGGEIRARKTLEKIGDYLGIGIANVIMGIGIPRVVISGRLVYGWDYIEQPLKQAIERSIVSKLAGWSVEAGEPAGSAIGGALEVAVEEFIMLGLNS